MTPLVRGRAHEPGSDRGGDDYRRHLVPHLLDLLLKRETKQSPGGRRSHTRRGASGLRRASSNIVVLERWSQGQGWAILATVAAYKFDLYGSPSQGSPAIFPFVICTQIIFS